MQCYFSNAVCNVLSKVWKIRCVFIRWDFILESKDFLFTFFLLVSIQIPYLLSNCIIFIQTTLGMTLPVKAIM